MPFSRTDLEHCRTTSEYLSPAHMRQVAKDALAEIDRLKAVNAELLAALGASEKGMSDNGSRFHNGAGEPCKALKLARAAIAKAKESS